MLIPLLLFTLNINGPLQNEPRFTAETIDDQINTAKDLTTADVDGDGKPDILLTEASRVVWYRNGDWKRFVLAEDSSKCYTGIAARDINGDGKAEIAVSLQSAQGKISDIVKSGFVHYLIRPENPAKLWTSIKLDQGYPVHGMQWVKVDKNAYQLVVLPQNSLKHIDGRQTGNVRAYEQPTDSNATWKRRLIRQPMPWANHLGVYNYGNREVFYVCGDSGIMGFTFKDGRWIRNTADWLARGRTLSEARIGRVASRNTHVFAAFEPRSANLLTIYSPKLTDNLLLYNTIGRRVIERKMNEGKGLAMADFLGIRRDQVVAGWKKPNRDGHFGIKLYVPFNQYWEAIDVYWIDRGGIACQDLQVADMDGDGKPDIVAVGRSTHNLKIYWNRSG